MEESMNYIIFSSTTQPKATTKVHAPQPSEEEQGMWDHYALGNEVFHAGINHTLSAAEERKCLEQEAADFDLWHGADFLSDSEKDPKDAQLLLDELERDDITSELLQNACKFFLSYFFNFTDLNVLDRLECS